MAVEWGYVPREYAEGPPAPLCTTGPSCRRLPESTDSREYTSSTQGYKVVILLVLFFFSSSIISFFLGTSHNNV